MIELFGLEGVALSIARAVVLTTGAFAWTMLLVRIIGLRAFAKMTSFDFVATVATASLIAQAGTRDEWGAYGQAIAAIGTVFLVQWSLARLRLVSSFVDATIRNKPLLLMIDGRFCQKAMNASRVSKDNLLETIRSSSASSIDDVRAVVLETTGDLSVITGERLDPRLMDGVNAFDERQADKPLNPS